MNSTDTFYSAPALSDSTSTLADAASMLRFTIERRGSAVLLRAGGELGASNVVTWTRLLSAVAGATAAPGPFLVDTDGLAFMGSCAFAALAERSARCRRRGIELRLVGNQPIVARLIAAGRFEAELPLYRTVHAALDAHPDVRHGVLNSSGVSRP